VHYDEGLLVGYRWYDASGARPSSRRPTTSSRPTASAAPRSRPSRRASGSPSRGLLHHFRSKEELLLKLLAMREERDLERIARAFEDRATLYDVLLALCRQNAESAGIVRLFTILAAESVDDDHPAHAWFQARYPRLRHDGASQVADDQREGRMAADLDPDQIAVQILALFDGLQIRWLLDPEGVNMVRAVEDFLEHLCP
jgi:AcrR family transcriptional regulator